MIILNGRFVSFRFNKRWSDINCFVCFFPLIKNGVNKMYHGVRGFDDHPVVELSMEKGTAYAIALLSKLSLITYP